MCRGLPFSRRRDSRITASQPTSATGSAIGTNENMLRFTPADAANPAMIRLELVPISVVDPASVVACATGSSTLRAGIPARCCTSLVAGMSIATIGVVLISDEISPTGGMSRTSIRVGLVAVDSSLNVTRDTTPSTARPWR